MKNYTDVMYEGKYESPITLTFKRAGLKYTLTGEGGNHRILIQDADGAIDLWVDDHCEDGRVFIHLPTVTGKPDPNLLSMVYSYLREFCDRDDRLFYHFTLRGMNRFFRMLYKQALVKSQLWVQVKNFDVNAA